MSGLQDVNRPDLTPEARVEIFRRWRWEATNDLRQRGVIQALTIWPEWVWAIMFLDKDREYRGWHPPKDLIGKRLAIHAGANIGGRKGMKARSEGLEAVARMARRAGWTVDATGAHALAKYAQQANKRAPKEQQIGAVTPLLDSLQREREDIEAAMRLCERTLIASVAGKDSQ